MISILSNPLISISSTLINNLLITLFPVLIIVNLSVVISTPEVFVVLITPPIIIFTPSLLFKLPSMKIKLVFPAFKSKLLTTILPLIFKLLTTLIVVISLVLLEITS